MAKLKKESQTSDVVRLVGVGIEETPDGWVAYRVSTTGEVETLTPERHGKVGELGYRALIRAESALHELARQVRERKSLKNRRRAQQARGEA